MHTRACVRLLACMLHASLGAACQPAHTALLAVCAAPPPLLQLWDVEKGVERAVLTGHTAEIVSVCFSTCGNLVATGSFDHDSRLWDARSGQCVHVLSGHRGEVSSTVLNHAGT